jgi:hypothetical protein
MITTSSHFILGSGNCLYIKYITLGGGHKQKGGSTMSEMMKRNSNNISAQQIGNAEKLCKIIMSVPEGERDIFTAVVSAYTDGFIAGEAAATIKNQG